MDDFPYSNNTETKIVYVTRQNHCTLSRKYELGTCSQAITNKSSKVKSLVDSKIQYRHSEGIFKHITCTTRRKV